MNRSAVAPADSGSPRPTIRRPATLTGTLRKLGSFSVPFYALRGGGGAAGRRQDLRQSGRLPPAVSRLRAERGQAAVQHWMARFGFSTNDWREYFDDPSERSRPDAERRRRPATRPFAGPKSTAGWSCGRSDGSGKSGIYMVSPKYQIVANGMYQGPWGINLGANLVRRQGYARAVLSQQRRPAIRWAKSVLHRERASTRSGCRRSPRSTRASRRSSRSARRRSRSISTSSTC